jgi:2-methylcitrate dehydratase PrpD
MANETKRLAQFVSGLTFIDLPPEVAERAKIIMRDTLSCAAAGYAKAKEEREWILSFTKDTGGSPVSTVWFDGFKTSAMMAALANATMTHMLDFDDTHIDSIAHLGAGLLAAVLALGEKIHASGEEILTAFVAGYEAGARAGNSVNKGAVHHHYKYWHPTATCTTIGCAAAAANMLKLNESETEYALGLGIDQACGLRYCVDKGDFSKSLHPGWSAMRGIMAGELVKLGANGPVGLFEYPTGFCNATCSEPHPEYITADLGVKYQIMRDALKMYPTIHGSHSSIEATILLVKENDIKPEQIESIQVKISPLAKGQGVNYAPASILAARLSLPFCIALAVELSHARLEDFTEALLSDKNHLEFMKKITVEPEPEFNALYPDSGFTGDVTIRLKDGKSFNKRVIYPKAHPSRDFDEQEVRDKFMSLSTMLWSETEATEIYDIFDHIEEHTIDGIIIPLT